MAENDTEARTWTDANGATILTIDGVWSDEIESALETVPFDGLDVRRGRGSFEGLAPFAEKIRWLHAPSVDSSAGLEALEYVEKITYVGNVPGPAFDYRRLPRLKSLTCDVAFVIPPEHLNHPNIERLDLEGLKVHDLRFLSEARRLRALRLATGPVRALEGLEHLPELRELRLILIRSLRDISALRRAARLEAFELDKTPNVTDVSPVQGLSQLRWLFVDARKAKQPSLSWIRDMPRLECAGIWVETESVDWSVFAGHPRLYDVVFHATRGFAAGSDEEIIARLSAGGRRVKALTRFPKAVSPAFRLEFVPPGDIEDPKPHWAYQNHLRY